MKPALFVILLSVCFSSAYTQERPPPLSSRATLSRLSGAYRTLYGLRRETTLKLAKEKNWPVFRVLPGGGVIRLERVDALGLPVYITTTNNIRSAATTGTDILWPGGASGLNLNGSSDLLKSRLGIWDGGAVLPSHQEFHGRINQKDEPLPVNEHATHVAGTLIAAGINRPARGMAFGASDLVTYDFLNDNAEMAEEGAFLLVSNHSYGAVAGWRFNDGPNRWEWNGEAGAVKDYKFGYYDITASRWDEIAYNAPFYLIVKSAGNNRNVNGPSEGSDYYRYNSDGEMVSAPGEAPFPSPNDGYDILPMYANAKNILLVGAVNPVPDGYRQASDVVMTSFSSWGPTDDGRIKPDVMGNGIGVLSTSSDGDDAYSILSGTSMAAPNISGSLFLLQELYSADNNGIFMRSATLRGLSIHTASEAGPAPGPDYQFGWGLLNAGSAADVIVNTGEQHSIQEEMLEQDAEDQFEVITSGHRPLEITLCWTDPGATPVSEEDALDNPAPRLVNDLDVRVTRSGGEDAFMPWILNPADPSAPAVRGDNILDNVEKLIIPDPGHGEIYTVSVSHKGTLQRSPQQYSLIMSGVGGKTYCASGATSNTGVSISGLQLGEFNYANEEECTGYTNLLSEGTGAQPGSSLSFSVSTRFCGTAGSHAGKIFADWNSDGDFTDAGETPATSAVLTSAGAFEGNIDIPPGLSPGTFIRMRIVMMNASNATEVVPCGMFAQGETLDISLEITKAATDIAVEALAAPGISGFCPGGETLVSVLIRNNGSQPQDSIPLSVEIQNGNTSVAAMQGIFEAVLQPGETAVYTFPFYFTALPSSGYTFELTARQPGDINSSNNTQAISRSSMPAGSTPPNVQAFICDEGERAVLAAPGQETVYWYDREQGGSLIGTGDTITTTFPNGQPTFYAALNDFKGEIGPAAKSDFPAVTEGPAYNQYTPAVTIETHVPLLIESARMYTGNIGKISVTVYDSRGVEISRSLQHVSASRNTAAPGPRPDDPLDTGRVYYLNLSIPRPGTYSLIVDYEGTASTIFRNNNSEGYPFSIPGIMSITGNTAGADAGSNYYYFYDMQIKALGCTSPRVPVAGVHLTPPVITQTADTLFSNVNGQLQWYFNGEPIEGANQARLFAPESGDYHLVFTLGNCSAASETYRFTTLDDLIAGLEDNGLKIYPNPGAASRSDPILVEFYAREQDLAELRVTDMLGKVLYKNTPALASGKNTLPLSLENAPPGIYILNLRINGESFARKFIIHR